MFGKENAVVNIRTQVYNAIKENICDGRYEPGQRLNEVEKNMLEDAIKTGTALDCSVNAELLKNIFWLRRLGEHAQHFGHADGHPPVAAGPDN